MFRAMKVLPSDPGCCGEEPTETYVRLSDVLNICAEWCPDDDGSVGKIGDLRNMLDELEDIPAADVAPIRHGRWVKMTGMMPPEFTGHYRCSECGWCGKGFLKEFEFDFCPGCGCEMVKEEEDE